jgi:hypothetical protein
MVTGRVKSVNLSCDFAISFQVTSNRTKVVYPSAIADGTDFVEQPVSSRIRFPPATPVSLKLRDRKLLI